MDHLSFCVQLGSIGLLPLELQLFLLLLYDMFQSGDGFWDLNPQLFPPLLEGGVVHGHV